MTFAYPHFIKDNSANGRVAVFVLTSAGIYSAVYLALIAAYEHWWWRLLHRAENYSGYWAMTITYEFLERPNPNGGTPLQLPYAFDSAFKISQSATHLGFPEGYSAPNE